MRLLILELTTPLNCGCCLRYYDGLMMKVFVCLGGGAYAALAKIELELLYSMTLALGILVRKYWDLAVGLLL